MIGDLPLPGTTYYDIIGSLAVFMLCLLGYLWRRYRLSSDLSVETGAKEGVDSRRKTKTDQGERNK